MPGLYTRWHKWIDRFFLADGYQAELLSVGVPAEKIFPIRGVVDFPAIVRTKSERERHRIEVRQRLQISQDAIIALSVGRLDPSKGHAYALEALPAMLERFPTLHWVVLGEGWKRTELEARIEALGVGQHSHLIGFVPNPLPFYAAADIYLRTAVFEAENLSSYAAVAMGLPVIGFDTGCATELIEKAGHGVLVPNGNAAAIATAAKQILGLPDRGQSLGEQGAEYAGRHLDIHQSINTVVTSYLVLNQARHG